MTSAADRESAGRRLLAEAESSFSRKSSLFSSLFGSASNHKETAAELFSSAGNEFKLAKSWRSAGDAFVRAARAFEEAGVSKFEAAAKYTEAAKAYKNVSRADAIAALEEAARLHVAAARFQQAAKVTKEVAEMYEAEGESAKAMERYTEAADLFDGEDAKSHASGCRVKIGELAAVEGDYARAVEMFEGAAAAALDSNLLKFGAKEHFLRAGMCWLCRGDEVGTSRALEKYEGMDSSFGTSREGTFLASIVKAVESGDAEEFTSAVYEFDRVLKLDPWKTSILLKIKNNIRAEEDDLT